MTGKKQVDEEEEAEAEMEDEPEDDKPEPLTSAAPPASVTVKTDGFREIVGKLNTLKNGDIFNFTLDPKVGIHIAEMDASQVAMIIADIPVESIKCTEAQRYAVRSDILSKILARAKETTTMTVEENKLKVSFENKNFWIPLSEPMNGPSKEPKVEGLETYMMETKVLKEHLKDAALFTSHVIFEGKDGKLTSGAIGDTGSLIAEFKINSNSKFKVIIPLEFMKEAVGAAEQTLISLAGNKPVKVESGLYRMWIAPRIESA